MVRTAAQASGPAAVILRDTDAAPDEGPFQSLGPVEATFSSHPLQGPRALVREVEAALRREAFRLGATHVFATEVDLELKVLGMKARARGTAARLEAAVGPPSPEEEL